MGIHRLPHLPYSRDIAPYDFWLFGYFKMKLEGMLFDTPAALLAEVEGYSEAFVSLNGSTCSMNGKTV
jgi:hypothetical protein